MATREFPVSKVIKACDLKLKHIEDQIAEYREKMINNEMTYTTGKWWWKETHTRTREEAIEYVKSPESGYYGKSLWDDAADWYPSGKTRDLRGMAKMKWGSDFIVLDEKDMARIADWIEKVDY